jgi:hypothetical protein
MLTEYQIRICQRMIDKIDSYLQGTTEYAITVNNLEALLDVCEIKDQKIVDKWFDCWTPLETMNALYGNVVKIDEIRTEMDDLKQYVKSLIEVKNAL